MSKVVKKHRDLNGSTCNQAGHNAASFKPSKAGGGYPHKQTFIKPGGKKDGKES